MNEDINAPATLSGNDIQIGPATPNNPNVVGSCAGTDLTFAVFPGGDPSQPYAWYSLDAGNTWIALTNNRITLVEATGNPVQWSVNMQAAGGVKFVINPGPEGPC